MNDITKIDLPRLELDPHKNRERWKVRIYIGMGIGRDVWFDKKESADSYYKRTLEVLKKSQQTPKK